MCRSGPKSLKTNPGPLWEYAAGALPAHCEAILEPVCTPFSATPLRAHRGHTAQMRARCGHTAGTLRANSGHAVGTQQAHNGHTTGTQVTSVAPLWPRRSPKKLLGTIAALSQHYAGFQLISTDFARFWWIAVDVSVLPRFSDVLRAQRNRFEYFTRVL